MCQNLLLPFPSADLTGRSQARGRSGQNYFMKDKPAPIRIRVAKPDDFKLLAQQRYAFRSEIGRNQETESAFLKRCGTWMKKAVATRNTWRCWIAESRGRFFGNVCVQLIEKIPNPVSERERHAYITNLYVVPDARGKRIGTRLLRTALTWCRRNEVDAVLLWPSRRSRALYQRHSFAVSDDLFALRLRSFR